MSLATPFPPVPALSAVCNELAKVRHKWKQICVQLGFPEHILKQFERETDSLLASVSYWLSGNVTVEEGEEDRPISWKSLVAALRSEFVGEPGLAEKINNKYCHLEDTGEPENVDSSLNKCP